MNKPFPSFKTVDIGLDSEEYEVRWKKYRDELQALIDAGTVHQDEDGWWVDNATGELIGEDPHDVRPLTDEDFAAMRPFAEVFPEAAEEIRRKRGRPPSENPKQAIKLRLDADVIERFKAGGAGWQTRMNEALRKAAGLR
jgi:uncharacterized protein (DUF4415 family)